MRKLLLVLLIAAGTAGCGIVYRQPIYQGNLLEKTNVDQLQVGMGKQQVIALLGSPSITDPFHQTAGTTPPASALDRVGRTEVKNLTLWFEGDALTRWEGDYFAEQDADIARNSVKQFGRNLPPDKKQQRGR